MGYVRELLLYKWRDTPEGEDCFKKMIYCGRIGAAVGAASAYFEVVANRRLIPVQTATGYGIRFITTTTPFVVGGMTFAGVSCVLTSLRQKDDAWNFFWGGMASGAVFGTRLRTTLGGLVFGTICGLMGAMKKMSMRDNDRWTMIKPSETIISEDKWMRFRSTLTWSNFDYSLTKFYEPRSNTYYFPSTVGPPPPAV